MPRVRALRLLPLAGGLGTLGRRVLATAWLLLIATMGLAALHTLFGVGGATLHAPVRDLASSVAYVLVAVIVWMRVLAVEDARGPWIVLATGITLYGAGNVLWVAWLQTLPEPPIPSIWRNRRTSTCSTVATTRLPSAC